MGHGEDLRQGPGQYLDIAKVLAKAFAKHLELKGFSRIRPHYNPSAFVGLMGALQDLVRFHKALLRPSHEKE